MKEPDMQNMISTQEKRMNKKKRTTSLTITSGVDSPSTSPW
jgi:hypothetical protein